MRQAEPPAFVQVSGSLRQVLCLGEPRGQVLFDSIVERGPAQRGREPLAQEPRPGQGLLFRCPAPAGDGLAKGVDIGVAWVECQVAHQLIEPKMLLLGSQLNGTL